MKLQLKNGIKQVQQNHLRTSLNGYVLIQQKIVVLKEHLVKIVENVNMVITDLFVQAMVNVM
jgi:hypothetical protein